VAAFKPAVTGLDDPGEWPADHELLAAAANAGQAPEDVAPYRYGPAASPHLAAELSGRRIDPAALTHRARALAAEVDALAVEGVGGLMVPLTPGYLIRDLAVDLGLPVVVAARAGLGTINHTLLTVESARGAGLDVRGVVMSPGPEGEPGSVAESNQQTVGRLANVEVIQLPRATPGELRMLGRHLPLDDWL
jgi:dethiobiotin synthetase